jgi:hypothetical protein
MGLQIWLLRDIENILWATQSVLQATTTASGSSGWSIGYDQGFKSTMQHITQSIETRLLSQAIWSCEDIEKALLVVRAVALPAVAGSEDPTWSADAEQGFVQGLEVALWCIATSFGINLLSPGWSSLPKRIQSPCADSEPLWFGEDIKNILLAAEEVVLATVAVLRGDLQPMDYNQGFEAALRCIAASFGVNLLTGSGFSLEKAMSSSAGPFWHRKDIENRLLVIYATMQAAKTASENAGRPALYWQGFEAALRCIATSFGLTV